MIPRTKDVVKFDQSNIPILKDILDRIQRLALTEEQAAGLYAHIKQTALTTATATITHTAPGTPDYAIQDLTAGSYGFVTKDEGNSVLKVIANLQARVNELETKLKALDLLA